MRPSSLIAAVFALAALPLGFLLADEIGEQQTRERLAEKLQAQLQEELGGDSEFLRELLDKAARGGGAFKLELEGEDAEKFLEGDREELTERLKDMLRKAQVLDGEELQRELRDNPDARSMELQVEPGDGRMGDLMRFFERQLETRKPTRNEKDHRTALAEWKPVVERASGSTALVLSSAGKQLALATVVDRDGYLVSKASELPAGDVTVELSDGAQVKGRVVDQLEEWDLALLKVDAGGLQPIRFAQVQPVELGSFLAASGTGDYPLAIGVASVAPRNLSRSARGFLGIGMERSDRGVRVRQVQDDSAARRAGFRVGDIILEAEGIAIDSSAQLATVIGKKRPGDPISIRYRRGENEREIKVELGKRGGRLPNFDRFNRGNQMGGRLSENREDYPNALQHDLTLRPEECGGPLVNLDGEAVGVNIARGGRVKSFAIPAAELQALLADVETGKFSMTDPKSIRAELDAAEQDIAEMERRLQEAKKRREAVKRALEKAER